MSIRQLFERIGAPLANNRWSWGAVRRDGAVVLRVWQNENKRINGRTHIQLTHHEFFVGNERDLGFQERLRHIEKIRNGATCYMVMCEPRDPKEVPCVIKKFNARELFIAGGIVELEGDLWVPIDARERIH